MYADVSLPVPLAQAFTYRLPATLEHRVQPGCRVLVPFGARTLTGVVLRLHDQAPEAAIKDVLKLLDEEPILDAEMLALGQWIAHYYCAPLGEVLRGMAPLAGETRHAKVYSLTDAGRDATRQLVIGEAEKDPTLQLLRLIESRPLSASYIAKKIPDAARILKALEKRGFATVEDTDAERDPLRASATRLRVEFLLRAEAKLPRPERELLSFLELHPGAHNLKGLEATLKNASTAARALARRGLVKLETEAQVYREPERPPRTLNIHQLAAYQRIEASLRAGEFAAFLLHGVTGSGKTEIYLRAIEACLALGRNALLLVPEIALTPSVAGQFHYRFGDSVAILHSAFHDAERAEQWRRLRSGAARVAVGTRSGVFAPIQNLGLIVVDEEHDQSYKQQETPRYHGRDVAILRARESKACVVLGSATPALESRYNAGRGKFQLIELPERIERRPMPDVAIVDMREEFLATRKLSNFSRILVEAIDARLKNGEQTMLLLNRRGFSSFVTCRACGHRIECPNCAVTLTYHRRDRRLLCHYCNHAQHVPSVCPQCESDHVQFIGSGSEKVEEELHQMFPAARVARMDRDTVSGKRHFETILDGFRERAFDILVGTQMIAKGHDIPNVTLVGVISADVGLSLPDFRSAERTFQLLTQAAGRAGRGDLPGIVLIQTMNPEHYAIRFAAEQDYAKFYEKEIQFRRTMRYPPFSALANILVRSEQQERALEWSAELGRLLDPAPEGIKALGPAEAAVSKIKREFRYQILLKATDRKLLNQTLQLIRNHALKQKWGSTALVIDVDPVTLL